MKIGLLTFHDTTNFGSLLQTFGLYKKILDLGYDIEVVDYQCKSIMKREIPKHFSFLQSPRNLIKDILLGTTIRKKYGALSKFLQNNMKLSNRCDIDTIKQISSSFDKFVVGSDIVWGMDIIEGDLTYFLNFESESKKKTAFSSSIGNPWNAQEKETIKPFLKDFSYIAVREDESAIWVKELTGNRPDVVCDPTMLLTTDDWRKYTYKRMDCGKYILVYFDNKNGDCIRSAIKIANTKGLKVKNINYGLPVNGVQNVKPLSLEDFLSLINDAAEVITASYHGMLFSIYFNKQFIYFNRAHKSRMNTLARKLQVTECNGEGKDVLNMPQINYMKVNNAVEDYRSFSIECLKKLLEI